MREQGYRAGGTLAQVPLPPASPRSGTGHPHPADVRADVYGGVLH